MAMTKMHLLWFCAFSPHAEFGPDQGTQDTCGKKFPLTCPHDLTELSHHA